MNENQNIHTDVLIHNTTYTLIETCQLGSHDEKKGNNENFRPADLGEQDLAKPWNAGGEKGRSGLRVLCSVARAGDGLRWIGGQLVGHSWVEYIAAAFWDTASAVPLLDIQLSPLAQDGIQKNLLDRQTEGALTTSFNL